MSVCESNVSVCMWGLCVCVCVCWYVKDFLALLFVFRLSLCQPRLLFDILN